MEGHSSGDRYLDQDVDVREEAGRIIIEPVRTRPRYTLGELVAQCPRSGCRAKSGKWLNASPVVPEAL